MTVRFSVTTVASNTRSNSIYSWTAHANMNRTDTHDGLNRILATGGAIVAHDARGNITTNSGDTVPN